jgi:hypothetical protein
MPRRFDGYLAPTVRRNLCADGPTGDFSTLRSICHADGSAWHILAASKSASVQLRSSFDRRAGFGTWLKFFCAASACDVGNNKDNVRSGLRTMVGRQLVSGDEGY